VFHEGDPRDLQRFLSAQAEAYADALSELRAGRKYSHWMWFVFPQIRGLGISSTAQFYGIADLAEARAYLAHPVLGLRLVECCEAMLSHARGTATEILGTPDDLKLRSSATLFATVSPPGSVFERVLARYYDGNGDRRTLDFISGQE
jgi:uncharacterized protein (DUF1810 family)